MLNKNEFIMHKLFYFVFMEAKNGDAYWDTFCGRFNSKESAIEEADRLWLHLTNREKNNRIVLVAQFKADESADPDEILGDMFASGYDVIYTANED